MRILTLAAVAALSLTAAACQKPAEKAADDSANNGEIVVALVMGEEATLKRIRRKGASIALEAANPAYETRIFGPDQVQVQGKLVGLIRRYH